MKYLRAALIVLMALFYGYAGYAHIVRPEPFLTITPDWVPLPEAVIFWTGVAEIAGAIGLLQPVSPALRKAAGAGLAAYALCVWPANINHFAMDMAKDIGGADGGLGLGYHIPRMIAQPILIWLALWLGGWNVRLWGRKSSGA